MRTGNISMYLYATSICRLSISLFGFCLEFADYMHGHDSRWHSMCARMCLCVGVCCDLFCFMHENVFGVMPLLFFLPVPLTAVNFLNALHTHRPSWTPYFHFRRDCEIKQSEKTQNSVIWKKVVNLLLNLILLRFIILWHKTCEQIKGSKQNGIFSLCTSACGHGGNEQSWQVIKR